MLQFFLQECVLKYLGRTGSGLGACVHWGGRTRPDRAQKFRAHAFGFFFMLRHVCAAADVIHMEAPNCHCFREPQVFRSRRAPPVWGQQQSAAAVPQPHRKNKKQVFSAAGPEGAKPLCSEKEEVCPLAYILCCPVYRGSQTGCAMSGTGFLDPRDVDVSLSSASAGSLCLQPTPPTRFKV